MDKSPKGTVFDIQRSSFHDGPGIRTTVFVKGCPLRCIWCHNPESQNPRPQVMYFSEKCVGCQACLLACDMGCHYFKDGKHIFDRSNCQVCGRCVDACSFSALEMKGKTMSAQEVFTEVLKDIEYYKNSGGGLTISGGEPLVHGDFSYELLRLCKEAGIHTCVETCGYVAENVFERFLPMVDLFLFDYKATDPQLHKELMGVANSLILKNLDTAYKAGKDIILRCPLVPGVNDDDHHLQGIARLSEKYPNLQGIEIMAYHNMGVAKSERLGEEAKLADLPNTSEEQKAIWLERLKNLGCTKVIIG